MKMMKQPQRPNKDNVDLDDIVIVGGAYGTAPMKILDITEGYLKLQLYEVATGQREVGGNYGGPFDLSYEEAIVLKKDGTYLVGEKELRGVVFSEK